MIHKSHIWNSFFESIISGIQSFYICPNVPVGIIRVFFNFRFFSRKSQSQQKKNLQKRSHVLQYSFAQKAHSFYEHQLTWHWKQYAPATQPKPFWFYKFSENTFTAPFLDAQELHSWSTLKANACIFLYISLRKFLFQRRSKVLSGKRWDGGRLNNFLKVVRCLGLAKYFKIFRFNWYFWKFNYF